MWSLFFLYVFVYAGYHTVYGIQHILQDYLPSYRHVNFLSVPRILTLFVPIILTVYLVM